MAAALIARRKGLMAVLSLRENPKLACTNGKRRFTVDNMASLKKLKEVGIPSTQAEALMNIIKDNMNYISQTFVSNTNMKTSQDRHFLAMQLEIEKFKADIQKILQCRDQKMFDSIHELSEEMQVLKAQFAAQLEEIKNVMKEQADWIKDENKALVEGLKIEITAQMQASQITKIKYALGIWISIAGLGFTMMKVMN